MVNKSVAAPCGLYCGTCRQYILREKDMLAARGYKRGCEGCRIRNKKCTFIRKDCPFLLKNELEFCYECEEFPCKNLEKLDMLYQEKYSVKLINNLKRIEEIGVEKWIQEQIKLYTCPECGGDICVHDSECFDCGNKINPNIK